MRTSTKKLRSEKLRAEFSFPSFAIAVANLVPVLNLLSVVFLVRGQEICLFVLHHLPKGPSDTKNAMEIIFSTGTRFATTIAKWY